jgi:pyridoxine 5-phosphate synthase
MSHRPRLSVNVNKIATIRNSRGGDEPSVLDAVHVCVEAGAPGITVHPRADARHITSSDVREISAALAPRRGTIEFNIEGDPREDLLAMVRNVKPDQCTLVPVKPGEITSQAGWPADTPAAWLQLIVKGLKAAGVRVSLFIDPDLEAARWAASMGADRIELYTEPWSSTPSRSPARSRPGPRRARTAFGSTLRSRRSRTTSVSASTPGTIWISTTWSCSGGCRTSTRSRSATR